MTTRETSGHRARTVLGPGAPEFREADAPPPREPDAEDLATPEAEIFGWECSCGNGSSFPMILKFAEECVVNHVEAMARCAERDRRLTFGCDPTATGVAALIDRLAGRLPGLLADASDDDREEAVRRLTAAIAALEEARTAHVSRPAS